MLSTVYTQIPRCSRDLLDEIAALPVADLHESLGAIEGRRRLMSPRMRPVGTSQRAAGQAVTAYNYPGDNLMIHAALDVAQRGDMLVLVNGGVPQGVLWGDVAATYAMLKGIAGVVADGPVRDTDALRRMGFHAWTTIVSPSHAEKRGPGSVNIPVVCDGVTVMPGDIVAADDDGVLVIPVRLARETIARARKRNDFERDTRQHLKNGRTLMDVLDMRSKLAAADVTIVEGPCPESGGG